MTNGLAATKALAGNAAAPRAISTIAREISKDWAPRGKGIYFGAVPYLNAMFSLTHVSDQYGLDSARSVVEYFLANAATWRGDTARRVKAELKTLLGR